jgi:hypothetical protein
MARPTTGYGLQTKESFLPDFIRYLAFPRDDVSHDIDVQGRTADLNLTNFESGSINIEPLFRCRHCAQRKGENHEMPGGVDGGNPSRRGTGGGDDHTPAGLDEAWRNGHSNGWRWSAGVGRLNWLGSRP